MANYATYASSTHHARADHDTVLPLVRAASGSASAGLRFPSSRFLVDHSALEHGDPPEKVECPLELVILLSLGLLGLGVRFLWWRWDWLSARGIEGLVLMFLLAWALSIVTTPFFAHGMTRNPKDLPQDAGEAFQLYLAVGGITFVALSVVFLILWLVGLSLDWLGL